ncbi:MAG: hypothetical protein HYX22_03415 [Candidatus Yanofskybacteria bacterium]|nr:hypothetical protein [Candidatus Yanofskybacteria bacterium]
MKIRTKFRILEFVIFGLISNLADNLLSLHFLTDQIINPRIILGAVVIVIPFAILEELVVDHPDFWDKFFAKFLRLKHKL